MTTDYFTVDSLAAHLDVPCQTIYAQVRAGIIDSFKVGKHIRIPKAGFEGWKVRQIKQRKTTLGRG